MVLNDNNSAPTSWSALARYAAAQDDHIVHVYVCESTLQSIIALSHALVVHALNPKANILFFYHTRLHTPNITALKDCNIQFFAHDSKALFLSAVTFDTLRTQVKNGQKIWLYISDRALWLGETFEDNFYYIAQAEKVFLYEEGDASYMGYAPVHTDPYNFTYDPKIANNPPAKQEILSAITQNALNFRTHYPLYQANGFTHYKQSQALADLHALCASQHVFHMNYYISQCSNVISFWQYPHLLDPTPELQNHNATHAHLDLSETIALLCPAYREKLFSYFNFNPNRFRTLHIPDPNKKNLIIIGTHSMYDILSIRAQKMEQMVAWIKLLIAQYSATHNVLFKPHPRFLSRVARTFISYGITKHLHFIPSSIPVELLALADMVDLYAATLSSSLYFKPVREKVNHIMLLPPLPLLDENNLQSKRLQLLIQLGYKKTQFKRLEISELNAAQLVNFWN